MISLNIEHIFIYAKPIDMRKGVSGLCALLANEEINPRLKGLYLFGSRSGKMIKGLLWDRNGFMLIYKRLEKGRFKIQFDKSIIDSPQISHEELRWLFAGLDYRQKMIFPELNISDFY